MNRFCVKVYREHQLMLFVISTLIFYSWSCLMKYGGKWCLLNDWHRCSFSVCLLPSQRRSVSTGLYNTSPEFTVQFDHRFQTCSLCGVHSQFWHCLHVWKGCHVFSAHRPWLGLLHSWCLCVSELLRDSSQFACCEQSKIHTSGSLGRFSSWGGAL